MGMNVGERARCIATFRFIEVRLMETAAAWTPTTPEMEVKVLLGRHIWDFAQHADALGKRVFELRLPLQHSQPPAATYAALIEDLARIDGTAERLSALYDAVLPGLDQRYDRYVSQVDPVLDAPSLLIVERIRQDLERQRGEAAQLRSQLAMATAAAEDWKRREAEAGLVP
jgi:hypothetical protein